MSEKRDYYEVLGVEKSASASELKNAFRSLARKYHPDRSQEDNAEEMFKEIQEAYAVLSDEQKRAQYDRFGHNSPGGSPFGGFGSGDFNINLRTFQGDFSQIYLWGGGGDVCRRGSDIRMYHSVDLKQIYEGSTEEAGNLPWHRLMGLGQRMEKSPMQRLQWSIEENATSWPVCPDVVRECPSRNGSGNTISKMPLMEGNGNKYSHPN